MRSLYKNRVCTAICTWRRNDEHGVSGGVLPIWRLRAQFPKNSGPAIDFPARYRYHSMRMFDHFYASGLCFSCRRCSACCRFEPGFVFLSEKDVSSLMKALQMKRNEFLETFCRWVPGENGTFQLSLKEKSSNDCIFWDSAQGGGCSVYESRPLQCRTFPFWDSVVSSERSWKMTAQTCPGMNKGDLRSRDFIEKCLAMRQTEPIISKD